MKRIAYHNLGCKVNAYELEVIEQKLQEMGYETVPFESEADIYIINTCTVTNIADRKSRQMLHRAKKKNPEAVVVAVGCFVQTGKEEAILDESIDLAVGNNRKRDLPVILEEYLKEREHTSETEWVSREQLLAHKTLNHISVIDINQEQEYEEMALEGTSGHTRAYIKIQDGCNQFCSYCIIPYARGRVRSRKQEDVLAEIRTLAKRGYREVVLTGIHISSYGMDFIGKNDGDYLESGKDLRGTAMKRGLLLGLVKEIAEVEGIERIRLGSLEPRIITKEFAEGLAALKKVCPHFHLSLQSGCDATLKRMNRHYTAGEYYEKVQILREVFERPAITTDVIVGFPGETEEEFTETVEFLKKINFFEMHVFQYSVRKGTVAAGLPDQVPEPLKKKRSAVLLELEKKQSQEYRESYIGQEITILTEDTFEKEGKVYRSGHTDTYVKAAFLSEKEHANEFISGKVLGFLSDDTLLIEK